MALGKRKVGVIGAGMVGICTASYLQRAGHEVFVIEPNAPGEGTSFGNAGGLNPSSVVPMSMPGMVRNVPRWLNDPLGPLTIRWRYLPTLAPWLIRFLRAGTPERVEAQARALGSLLGPCLETLAPLVQAAAAEDLVQRRGLLFVYRSAESRAKDGAAWDLRRRHGIVFEELGGDEIHQLEPTVARDYVRGIFVPGNGHTTNPHRLVNSLADAFRRAGGRIIRGSARGFALDGARLNAIRTDEGELPADAAVVTAGIRSRPLAATLGDDVPLETERGYHMMIRDPEVMPRLPVADGDGKFVATPMETGLRIAGQVELAGLDAEPDWRRARIMLEHGRRLLPALAAHYPEARLTPWMGHRPSTPDSLPVIGTARRSPDVFYAFGHGHVGMAASPMTGKTVAEMVSGRPPGIDVTPFRADRF